MDGPSPREMLYRQSCLGHLIGLAVVGAFMARETAGMALATGAAIIVGGAISLPWIIAMMVVIWKWSGWLTRHIAMFCVAGPIIVCATWLLIKPQMLEFVAPSTIIASLTVAGMRFAGRLMRRSPAE